MNTIPAWLDLELTVCAHIVELVYLTREYQASYFYGCTAVLDYEQGDQHPFIRVTFPDGIILHMQPTHTTMLQSRVA